MFEDSIYLLYTHPILYQTFLLIGVIECIIVLFKSLHWLLKSIYTFYLSQPINLRVTGDWAVITGCTDGIGKGYTEKLASLGFNLVLLSRTQEKLETQSALLKEKYKIQTLIIQIDFSDAGQDLYQSIAMKLNGLDIGILINNVGVSTEYPGYFCDEENQIEDIKNMIFVNCHSFLRMTHMVLPGMLDRNRGVIINISSGSGVHPIPLLSNYSGTKAFIQKTSQALNYEYKSYNILIQTLSPYLVSTNMSRFKKSRIFIPNVHQFINHSIRSIGRHNDTSGYFSHEVIAVARFYWPVWFDQWFIFKLLLSRRLYGRKRKAKQLAENKTKLL